MEEKVICLNRSATHEYFILDRLEAGIVLEGSEVKSLRLGNANLKDCFCVIHNGELILKNMHIVGEYENGNFISTKPLSISMRHVDGIGTIELENGEMYTTLDLTMRGTSPSATTIQLDIMPDGTRRYSLSEILINFDGDYLREFIKTHNKF